MIWAAGGRLTGRPLARLSRPTGWLMCTKHAQAL